MLEVKEIMEKAINEILQNNLGQKVVIVSHGAAIKFYLSKWCEFRENKLLHNNTEMISWVPCSRVHCPSSVFSFKFCQPERIDGVLYKTPSFFPRTSVPIHI